MLFVKHKLISEGSMSSVYEAYSDTGLKVALKQIPASIAYNPVVRKMFFSEANSLLKMNHPDVVRIVADPYDDPEGNLYLPMEFIEGNTLSQGVKMGGRYSESKAKTLMSRILDAFDYIHSMGVVHRDVKPSNIMVRPDGSICVIDFGIVKLSDNRTGLTGNAAVGTSIYMSPEQASGLTVDYRSDIYSLGCLLYYLVTGQHAFKEGSGDYATIHSVLYEEFPKPKEIVPSLSKHIQDVILTATSKNMLKRYQSASNFKAALNGEYFPVRTNRNPMVTVGRSGTDVLVYGSYVSSYHLDICYVDGKISLTDRSSNGTSVGGQYLRSGTVQIPFKLSGNVKKLPRVFLAGREECELPWDIVIARLREKIGNE